MKPGPKPLPPEKRKKLITHRYSPQTLRAAAALSRLLSVDRTAAFERSVVYCLAAVKSGELDPEELLSTKD